MCDNKNDLHRSENDKSKDYTSTRLDLDITETTDSYPEFDFLDLLRNLQVKEKQKKAKHKCNSEVSSNKSNFFSDEDSDIEALAKLYEEKYGTCNDYAELGEGYDEEDSFIDNSDAVNDLVPSGIQTEFGGFYINRGKLNFVKEDNSSSSTSEDVDKFLKHNRSKARKVLSDDEDEEKETTKGHSNNQQGSVTSNNIQNSNNVNNSVSSNNSTNINHSSFHNNVIKSRKKSKDYQHKTKKIRKTATPKIPDHLLYKKPFPGSTEFRKNINEIKKNKLKTVEPDKPSSGSNSTVSSGSNNEGDNNTSNTTGSAAVNSSTNNHHKSSNSENNSNNSVKSSSNKKIEENVHNEKKEETVVKKKPPTVKELLKEREASSDEGKVIVLEPKESTKNQSSSSSDSSDSSSSDSESSSSEDSPAEKETVEKEEKAPVKKEEKPVQKPSPVEAPPKNKTINGSIPKENTAKSFAHQSDSWQDLVTKIFEISKEEKSKGHNSRLNSLLLSLEEKIQKLPPADRNTILDNVAEMLQMKKDNIIKRIKKLQVLQEEAKMSLPMRKLKEAINNIMPVLESNYFNEYTKAAGTSPQIYAELSRYYWSIDPGALPQRKFPWTEELRHHLREIVHYRQNCYYIIKPRKESMVDFIKSFLDTKVKPLWPKDWMTVDILVEEALMRPPEDKQKPPPKVYEIPSFLSAPSKKATSNVPNSTNRKQPTSLPSSSAPPTQPTNRKPSQTTVKNPEVKSVLIPRKTPSNSSSNTSTKTNYSATTLSALHSLNQGSRLQVTLNRVNVQDYLDRMARSQGSVSKNSSPQISHSRSQQSGSPNRPVKPPSSNPTLNPSAFRNTPSPKVISPNSSNKSMSPTIRNTNTPQSVLKPMGAHGNPITSTTKTSSSVTISPVNEVFKDMTPSSEVLNLTKNSSLYISKVKDCSEPKTDSNSSPIGFPLPSGITISPTNASPSTFLSKSQKPPEKNPDVKINVSISKQDTGLNLAKEKRDDVVNVKREGPLQNIPDCISVTPKVVSNDKPKYEHVRKRALQEYRQQQSSPDRPKPEEKKLKTDDNLLTDMEMKDDKLDDKHFSKIFDSVIAKTSETVRQSETSQPKIDRYNSAGVDLGPSNTGSVVRNAAGVNQFQNYPPKIRDVRGMAEPSYYYGDSLEDKNYRGPDNKAASKEQRVQMEMDRVMQNLVELSREKNPEYDTGYSTSPPGSTGLKPNFQESFQKMLFK